MNNAQPGDSVCQSITGLTTFDSVRLDVTFDLAPGFDGIQFLYTFGSEEYPEFVGLGFTDPFGVFVNGVNVTVDPSGNPISIEGPFFSGGTVVTPPTNGSEYDGMTPRILAQAPLQGGSTGNSLTIVVCDALDGGVDSGAFLSGLGGCVGACSGVQWCGDGILEPGTEQCDDGNHIAGDGCSVACTVESN